MNTSTTSSQALESFIGECIMPSLDSEKFETDEAYREEAITLVREHLVGGFCVFAESANSVAEAVKVLQEIANQAHGTPLIFSCDCEFGVRMRLKEGGTEFPDAMAIAKSGDPELARAAGKAIAKEMRALGLGWNFAPVVDVNNNPRNPIINTRSFGDDPNTVIAYSVPFVEGLQSERVAATAKHFPGHGDTTVDSHRALPVMHASLRRFEETELPPFEATIGAGVDAVMTGHLAVPELASDLGGGSDHQSLPATLSPTITTTLLRERLGFDGVIVTDALQMRAVADQYGEDEAAVLSFEAGADVILMPFDARRTHAALRNAVDSGRITRERVEHSMRRITALKTQTAIEISAVDPSTLDVMEEEHHTLAFEIAKRSIQSSAPIEWTKDLALTIVCDDRPVVIEKAEHFERAVHHMFLSTRICTPQNWSEVERSFDRNSVIVTFYRARGYLTERATEWTFERMVETIAASFDHGTAPKGLVLFGSPYLDREFTTSPEFVMKTYSESEVSIDAVIHLLESHYSA